MFDPRPAPQYGEYATPEEVAARRGVPAELSPVTSPAPDVAAPRRGARRYDRPVTFALLLFGLINVVQYAGPLFDFELFLEQATAGTPTESIDFGAAARIGGFVIFGVMLVMLLVAGWASYLLLRRGRIAFWVPLVAGALTVLAWVLVLVVIVFNTPGALGYGALEYVAFEYGATSSFSGS